MLYIQYNVNCFELFYIYIPISLARFGGYLSFLVLPFILYLPVYTELYISVYTELYSNFLVLDYEIKTNLSRALIVQHQNTSFLVPHAKFFNGVASSFTCSSWKKKKYFLAT